MLYLYLPTWAAKRSNTVGPNKLFETFTPFYSMCMALKWQFFWSIIPLSLRFTYSFKLLWIIAKNSLLNTCIFFFFMEADINSYYLGLHCPRQPFKNIITISKSFSSVSLYWHNWWLISFVLFRLQFDISLNLTFTRKEPFYRAIVTNVQGIVRIRCILYTVCLLWCSDFPLPCCSRFSTFALDIAPPRCIYGTSTLIWKVHLTL